MVGPRKNMTPATASVFVRPCGDAAAAAVFGFDFFADEIFEV